MIQRAAHQNSREPSVSLCFYEILVDEIVLRSDLARVSGAKFGESLAKAFPLEHEQPPMGAVDDQSPRKRQVSDEALRHLCTNVWSHVFLKQVDRLQRNKQGTYLVTDRQFHFLDRLARFGFQEAAVSSELNKYRLFAASVIAGFIGYDSSRVALQIVPVPMTALAVRVLSPEESLQSESERRSVLSEVSEGLTVDHRSLAQSSLSSSNLETSI